MCPISRARFKPQRCPGGRSVPLEQSVAVLLVFLGEEAAAVELRQFSQDEVGGIAQAKVKAKR